jgi:basic amino acid/polyamine antiporter, APA family
MSHPNPPTSGSAPSGQIPAPIGLSRSLSLTHAVLYGLGVTIGAGIYVLVGAAVGRAGAAAPYAFAIAALLMTLTAASFAELGTRMPVAAGEAAYIRAGFRSNALATVTGLIVIAIAIVSSSAISVGAAGYLGIIVPLPEKVLITVVVLTMGLVAAWGIRESVTFAGIMTLIEIGGLVVIVVAGVLAPPFVGAVGSGATVASVQSLPPHLAAGLASATLLAVFAFLGFEGLANVAEELRDPRRDLPRAIFLTLTITTVLYMAVVWVALRAASQSELGASNAPLALVFERVTGASPIIMTFIAIVATINGIIVQMIMSARVLYGLSVQGSLPSTLGRVHPATHTPVNATILTVAIVLVLALFLPLDQLADWASQLTLILFALVNAALVRLKMKETKPPENVFLVPAWVPWGGVVSTLGVLIATSIAW